MIHCIFLLPDQVTVLEIVDQELGALLQGQDKSFWHLPNQFGVGLLADYLEDNRDRLLGSMRLVSETAYAPLTQEEKVALYDQLVGQYRSAFAEGLR